MDSQVEQFRVPMRRENSDVCALLRFSGRTTRLLKAAHGPASLLSMSRESIADIRS